VTFFLVGLVETICQCGRGGLIDDTEDVQAGDDASILGGSSLRIVEVCWNRDDGVDNLLALFVVLASS
jgi:hypothetical protein